MDTDPKGESREWGAQLSRSSPITESILFRLVTFPTFFRSLPFLPKALIPGLGPYSSPGPQIQSLMWCFCSSSVSLNCLLYTAQQHHPSNADGRGHSSSYVSPWPFAGTRIRTLLLPPPVPSPVPAHLSFPAYRNDLHSFFNIRFSHLLQKVITDRHTPLPLGPQIVSPYVWLPIRSWAP